MKWFKHMCDASDDPAVVQFEAEFGDFGYKAWFKILEKIGRNLSPTSPVPEAQYPTKIWCRYLATKPQKLRRFLALAAQLRKIQWDEDGQMLRIKCDKLLEIKAKFSKGWTPSGHPNDHQMDPYGDIKSKEEKEMERGDLRARSMPKDFELTKEQTDALLISGIPKSTLEKEFPKFKAHYLARGDEKRTDWLEAFRGWLLREGEFGSKEKKSIREYLEEK